VPVVVRTLDDADLDNLKTAGATEVVPEAIEGSLMLAGHALALVGVPMKRVIRIARDARDARYSPLCGRFHGTDDDTIEDLEQLWLLSVTLPEASRWAGQAIDLPALHAMGVSVISLRRAGGGVVPARGDTVLAGGDALVLSGLPGPLALAEGKLPGAG
jgi:CPA2 family monovalent cation:H+ antiporter-2